VTIIYCQCNFDVYDSGSSLSYRGYPEKCIPCPPGSYAVPLLKHGCAELASAQHTIPAKRVFHQLMVIG